MITRWLLASLHLIALGIGLGSVFTRARLLRGTLTKETLKRAFLADSWWGIAALVWISTGLIRAFGGFEKGTRYYLDSPLFLIKMGLLGVVIFLEIAPMVALIRWRIGLAKGLEIDTSRARRFALISDVQTLLVILMVFVATAMARGLWLF